MLHRVAALDLGTNTFHLLIADLTADSIEKIIVSEQRHVKLGEGGINNSIITSEAFQRGLDAMNEFMQLIETHQPAAIRCVGTSALRSAQNGAAFVHRVKQETGIDIEIIDGDREAFLIFNGVKQAVNLANSSVIMDIGGGSVEFIFADASGISWKKSYPIGAARLMEQFHHSDPISETDVAHIKTHLDDVLKELIQIAGELKPKSLVGSAGAFETFAALCQIKSFGKEASISQNYNFDLNLLHEATSYIKTSTHRQREENAAILSVRKDMIVVAAVLTDYIIEKLGINKVFLSTFALKEGLLFDSPLKP